MYWSNKLYDEQRAVLKKILRRHGSLIIGDVGTGKTLIALAAVEQLKPSTVLIISPLTSLDTTWAPRLRKVPGLLLCRDLATFKNNRPGTSEVNPRCLLLHYQEASKDKERLGKIAWDLVIVDEAHGLKSRSSGWSRMARRLRHAKDRIAMTATPMDESPLDLWAIMRFVNHQTFGEDFTPFAEYFCHRGGFKNKQWMFNRTHLPKFLKRMEPYVSRLTKKFLELPPLKVHLIGVDMLGQQRRIYDTMAEHGIVEVDGIKIKAPLKVTQQGKLEQITGGGILDEDDNSHFLGSAKCRKLNTLLTRLKGQLPVVVACKYLHEIPACRKVLQSQMQVVKELHGAVKDDHKDKARTDLINEFQDGRIDGLVLQVRTGGVSIELSRASVLIVYSMNFSLIDFEQLLGRLHRAGQDKPVNVFIIHAKNSVDTKIISDIEDKHSSFYQVVDYFEEQEDIMPKAKTKSVAKSNGGDGEALPFGINEAAKHAKVTPVYLRIKFRKAGIKRSGKSYGWTNQKSMIADLKRAEAV